MATLPVLTTLLVLATLAAMLAVLSVALPRRSVVPWAARTVITSGTVLLSSSKRRTSTGKVTVRVILDTALLRVQKTAQRPLVALLSRNNCVRLAHRHRLLLLAALIHLSTTGWCSTAAGRAASGLQPLASGL